MSSRKTKVQAVLDFYAAIQDSRVIDVLALVHPDVGCVPLARDGMGRYSGHQGMIALIQDMHGAHGHYQAEIDGIRESGPRVTADARIFPEPGYGRAPLSIRTMFSFRDGLIEVIRSEPGPAERAEADRRSPAAANPKIR